MLLLLYVSFVLVVLIFFVIFLLFVFGDCFSCFLFFPSVVCVCARARARLFYKREGVEKERGWGDISLYTYISPKLNTLSKTEQQNQPPAIPSFGPSSGMLEDVGVIITVHLE